MTGARFNWDRPHTGIPPRSGFIEHGRVLDSHSARTALGLQSPLNEPTGRSSSPRAAIQRSNGLLADRRRPRPNECRSLCNSSVVVDLFRFAPTPWRTGAPYPNTGQPLNQKDAPTPSCPDSHSRLAALVPTGQTRGYAGLDFALRNLRLRRTPANRLVMLERATK